MSNQGIRFEAWGITHTGMVRALNEDRFLLKTDDNVWVVADGMGGHEGGEIASASVVDSIESIGIASSAPDLRSRVIDRLRRANSEIQRLSRERDGAVIGSTVVSLLAYDGQFGCLWCGDSRLYMVRDGQIQQISRDHSEIEELLADGVISDEEARNWPRKNVITRAIGVSAEPLIDHVYGEINVGDSFILCSDGLTAHMEDEEIRDLIAGRRAETACQLLIDTTLERGATDNVTVVVVNCRNAEGTVPVSSDMM
ncbi:MAG: PP2C family protein-serine/threonine phosphatase [Rhizobiaceae bacterium]